MYRRFNIVPALDRRTDRSGILISCDKRSTQYFSDVLISVNTNDQLSSSSGVSTSSLELDSADNH